MRLVSRSENSAEFRPAFVMQADGPAAIWDRFLSLAPPGFAEFWVAFEQGKPVGRIGASRLPSYPRVGAIGFFEAQSETAARALMEAALSWLRAQGMAEAVGPMCLNTWFPYRFRVDDHSLQFRWEPGNPKVYPEYFRSAGFSPVEEYHTPAAEGLPEYVERTRAVHDRLLTEGFTFRAFDTANFLEKEVPLLHRLSHVGFRDNYLFEPIAPEFFRELYVPLAAKLDFSHSFFALTANGREAGVFFIFPDGEYLIFKTITILPEYRGKGMSTALSHLGARRAVENGMSKYATALIRNGNHSESYTQKGKALWEHRYVLYAKSL